MSAAATIGGALVVFAGALAVGGLYRRLRWWWNPRVRFDCVVGSWTAHDVVFVALAVGGWLLWAGTR